SLQIQSTSSNSTRSRLLHIHQNITKNLKDTPIIQTPSLTTSIGIESEPSGNHKKSEEIDQLIDLDFINTNFDCKSETNESNSVRNNQREPEKPTKKSHHITVEDAELDKE
ncbi:36976_t:CDS:2, partial [Gigaspora margarita]